MMKSKILKKLEEEGESTLTEYEAKQVLREYDIPCPDEFILERNGDIIDQLSNFNPGDEGLKKLMNRVFVLRKKDTERLIELLKKYQAEYYAGPIEKTSEPGKILST